MATITSLAPTQVALTVAPTPVVLKDASTTETVSAPSTPAAVTQTSSSGGSSTDSNTVTTGIYTALANTNGSTIRGSNLNIQA